MLSDCPVNIECIVEQEIVLDSHTMFIGLVQTVHAEESLLDEHGDVDVASAKGIIYDNGTVREKPNYKFRVENLRRAARAIVK